jgi:hypothetical protein
MAMAMREKIQEKREVSRGREEVFCFVFLFVSLGQRGGEERTGIVS